MNVKLKKKSDLNSKRELKLGIWPLAQSICTATLPHKQELANFELKEQWPNRGLGQAKLKLKTNFEIKLTFTQELI